MTAEMNVFSFRRNTDGDEADVVSSGRPYHSLWAIILMHSLCYKLD